MPNFNQIQRDEQSILAMQAGDRVWHQSSHNLTIQSVSRVTDKAVYVGGRAYWRAAKETKVGSWNKGTRRVNGHYAGAAAPGIYSGYGYILRIATSAECAEWDRKQQVEADKRKAAEDSRIAHDELLTELAAGLNCTARVRDTEFGVRGTFDVILEGLTEAQVRKLTITLG